MVPGKVLGPGQRASGGNSPCGSVRLKIEFHQKPLDGGSFEIRQRKSREILIHPWASINKLRGDSNDKKGQESKSETCQRDCPGVQVSAARPRCMMGPVKTWWSSKRKSGAAAGGLGVSAAKRRKR
jgi:L,D-peptidoglycan transpeptidase YkuD (ErfK/YbiS/YcfS/YnhG family)